MKNTCKLRKQIIQPIPCKSGLRKKDKFPIWAAEQGGLP
jgi:hypothetical protein